nr:zinc finger, CCHC-type [Tanacetum cinerariifolium]
MTTSVENNSVFRSFFEKQKLTGPNFIDWYRQLRLVLSTEDKENYLEHPIPVAPIALPGQQVPPEALIAHAAWVKRQKEVAVLMLLTMDLEIQRNLAHLGAYDMLQELKALYSKQAEQELLQTVREFHACKQEEGQPVSSYVLKMKSYIDNLERLGQPLSQNLVVNLILVSLNKDYDSFVHNYNMHGMGKTVNELHAMLKLHEDTLPKKDANHALHAIRAGRVQITIKINRTKLIRDVMGLRGSKKLKPGALSLYMGDGHRAAIEAIGTYHLELPSGLVIVLNNCHYAPSITRGISKRSKKQLRKTIKSLPSDRGGEYTSQEFLDHLKEDVIIAHRTPPYTPQHNGVSERRNQILLDLHVKAPKLSYLKVWGCEALVKRDTLTKPDKLDPRSFRCIFVGYPKETMRYCLYIPSENKVFVAQNAEFFENDLIDLKVIELPPNARTVGSKWLFRKKTDIDGTIYVFKARLVAKGFTQTYGVDYEETFSPVADIRAIRILIAIATYYNYEIWQMDAKTAFLNGHLSEEVYMEQPEGFVNPKYANHVCKLKRFIYGLKQASRSFAMKDLGDAAYIFGIKIYRDKSKRLIGLCQSAYIEKILKIYYMENSKRGMIPMQEKLKLSKSQGEEHWTAVKNILKYLRNTKDMFLVYGGYVFVLNGGVVNWKSTKQSIFTTSSTNAEYIVAFDESKEAVWIRKFISGLGIVPTIKEPISMYCDNTRAIAIVKDDGVTKGARHFHAKVHYLCETIKLGDLKIEKVDIDDNLADPFTKALAFLKHSELTRSIEMLPASSFM